MNICEEKKVYDAQRKTMVLRGGHLYRMTPDNPDYTSYHNAVYIAVISGSQGFQLQLNNIVSGNRRSPSRLYEGEWESCNSEYCLKKVEK